jgi:hypothetical protein
MILRGGFDKHLNAIASATRERQQILRKVEAADVYNSLEIGTRVRLKDLRPKYLNGIEGNITSLTPTGGKGAGPHVRVDLDYPQPYIRNRYNARGIVVPVACVEIVDVA